MGMLLRQRSWSLLVTPVPQWRGSWLPTMMGRAIFSIYWPSQFPSNFCSTATPVGKIIPIFYCFQHQATFDMAFDGLHLLLPSMSCPWHFLLTPAIPAAIIPLHPNEDFSVILFPSPLHSIKNTYKNPCLDTGLNASIRVYLLQWNRFSKQLLYFPLLVTPLVTGFQESIASTFFCSNSYDGIFGIAQGQYS